jgi:hypothetical protein
VKYTPVDLNRMRESLWEMISYQSGGSYSQGERERSIEAQLQTHMMNETTPEELEAEVERVRADYSERRLRAIEAEAERAARHVAAFAAVETRHGRRWWHL